MVLSSSRNYEILVKKLYVGIMPVIETMLTPVEFWEKLASMQTLTCILLS